MGTSRYVQVNDNWYYVNAEGKILKGEQTIDGVQVHFDTKTGQQIKGGFTDKDGKLVIKEKYYLSGTPMRYYDKDSGALVKNQYFNHNGNGTMQMQKVISLKAHKPSMGYMFTLTIMVYKLKILFLMVTTTIKILAHGKSSLVISLLKLVTIYTILAVMDELEV